MDVIWLVYLFLVVLLFSIIGGWVYYVGCYNIPKEYRESRIPTLYSKCRYNSKGQKELLKFGDNIKIKHPMNGWWGRAVTEIEATVIIVPSPGVTYTSDENDAGIYTLINPMDENDKTMIDFDHGKVDVLMYNTNIGGGLVLDNRGLIPDINPIRLKLNKVNDKFTLEQIGSVCCDGDSKKVIIFGTSDPTPLEFKII